MSCVEPRKLITRNMSVSIIISREEIDLKAILFYCKNFGDGSITLASPSPASAYYLAQVVSGAKRNNRQG